MKHEFLWIDLCGRRSFKPFPWVLLATDSIYALSHLASLQMASCMPLLLLSCLLPSLSFQNTLYLSVTEMTELHLSAFLHPAMLRPLREDLTLLCIPNAKRRTGLKHLSNL